MGEKEIGINIMKMKYSFIKYYFWFHRKIVLFAQNVNQSFLI